MKPFIEELMQLLYFFPLFYTKIQNGRRSCCNSSGKEGSSQIQAEECAHLQEQGPQTRPEGVRLKPSPSSLLSVLKPPIICPPSLSTLSRFGDDIPGMEGLGTDITVICPWEAYGDMELSDLAKYGII